ncbi:phosphate ABC transporter substrate-binding/OmpA family protein [Pseudogemmobacter faecipullorum]|nr:phosphate ABC transporter substrate-binding/OmpA family protein [Pseudogemmobacter faecipullorum]
MSLIRGHATGFSARLAPLFPAMRRILMAALLTGLVTPGLARAEDITLRSLEGNIVLPGRLQGYDGEFYRIETAWGPLTIDGSGVMCEGPACPDLVAPRAMLRIIGAEDPGLSLMPGLLRSFATARGLTFRDLEPGAGEAWAAQITSPAGDEVLADIAFTAASPEAARAALDSGAAEFELSALPSRGADARPIALDAMVPVMAPGNPTPRLSTPALAAALAGTARNWSEFGGPDMPVVLHALAPETDMGRALAERLGAPVKADVLHEDMASLAAAVAKDPWALAITGKTGVAPAMIAPLSDSCGFPLLPSPVSVKAGDYPLALPLYLVTPPRRLPLFAREFLEFLATPAANQAVAQAGYIDRAVEAAPMTADGLRLLNAIRGAGEDVTLEDLKRLAEVMEGADRLSLTFRFEEGTSILTASGQENLRHLARMIAAQQFPAKALILAGFSDGAGDAGANRALSRDRAARVVQDLAALAPDLRPEELPRIEGFGEALPMACDETVIGRRLNRRVELWLVPDFRPEPL